MIRNGSPLSDPAVGAGFAAAYGGVCDEVGPDVSGLGDRESAPTGQVPTGQVPTDPVLPEQGPTEQVPAGQVPAEQVPAPGTWPGALARPPLERPLLRSVRRARAPQPGRLSPSRALAGAAVSVGGVLLGIGSLLVLTGDPPLPADEAARAAAPTLTEQVPRETEIEPVDPVPVDEPPAALTAPDVAAPSATAPTPSASAAPTPATASALPAPAAAPPVADDAPPSTVVPVTVLNNSRRTGLADRAATRFERGGWPVAETGNFQGRIPVTTVYYDPGFEGSARAFAEQFDGMARVRPRFDTLPARGLVVVLTREFGA